MVCGVLLYEGLAVARARAATPAVLARAATGELPLSSLSRQRIDMLLTVEDPGFYRHRGVDFSTPGQGRTTLTQALVKRFYFDDFQPGFAKIEQSLIAWLVLDPAMTKPQQLSAFVNHASFGHFGGRHIVGFAHAARTYYDSEFSALSEGQFLGLVAMLMGPNKLDPIRRAEANTERVARLEALLAGRCKPAGWSDVTYGACA